MPFEQHLRDFAVKKPCTGGCPDCKSRTRAGEDGAGELSAASEAREAEVRRVVEGVARLRPLTSLGPEVETRLIAMLQGAFAGKVGA